MMSVARKPIARTVSEDGGTHGKARGNDRGEAKKYGGGRQPLAQQKHREESARYRPCQLMQRRMHRQPIEVAIGEERHERKMFALVVLYLFTKSHRGEMCRPWASGSPS